jgi:hypothetical protein
MEIITTHFFGIVLILLIADRGLALSALHHSIAIKISKENIDESLRNSKAFWALTFFNEYYIVILMAYVLLTFSVVGSLDISGLDFMSNELGGTILAAVSFLLSVTRSCIDWTKNSIFG